MCLIPPLAPTRPAPASRSAARATRAPPPAQGLHPAAPPRGHPAPWARLVPPEVG